VAELYLITCATSGKRYVGITSKTAQERWREHTKKARRLDTALARAIQKYGRASFTVQTLLRAEWEYVEAVEQPAIERFGAMAPCGYNVRGGGAQPKMNEATKAKLSVAARRQFASLSAREAAADRQRGKRHSEEARVKMSLARKGRRQTESDRAKKSAAAKLRWQRPGERGKARQWAAARWQRPDERERCSQWSLEREAKKRAARSG
jgi:group I intron endonuclease